MGEVKKFDEKEKDLFDIDSTERNFDTSVILNIINKHRVSFALLIIGITLIGFGLFYLKFQDTNKNDSVVFLEEDSNVEVEDSVIVVEIAGAIKKPGVYEFASGSRVEDLLVKSGGFTDNTDLSWVEKFVNRASVLSDGQKLYIPKIDEQLERESANSGVLYQSDTSVLGGQGSTIVNINTATQSQLEELWGIGPVYARNIIEQRPYSSVEELLEKGVIKSNVYERNKDIMKVY